MVACRAIACLFATLALGLTLRAQNYSSNDTTTEYPNKGTFYHNRFVGRKTASGEIFDQNRFTAAHWRIKLGTLVLVTNRNTGKQVIVKVNDRCPRRGVFDMTRRAAHGIGIRGCQPVTVRLLPPEYEEQWLAQETLFDSVEVTSSRKGDSPTVPISVQQAVERKKTEAKLPAIPAPTSSSTNCYNLRISIISNHAEAFNLMQQLPKNYQEKLCIDELPGSEEFQLLLELQQPRKKVEEIRKKLCKKFPDSKIVPCD